MLAAARRDPSRLFIGIDSNLQALTDASTRAARKPARGGAPNAWFVRAAAEGLPAGLADLADRVTVLLPWGSLLAGVLAPEPLDPAVLRGIRLVARASAALEVVVSLDERDRGARALRAPAPDSLLAPYRAAGWRLRRIEPLDSAALAEVGTTWAKRLAHGRPRAAWRITATADGVHRAPVTEASLPATGGQQARDGR